MTDSLAPQLIRDIPDFPKPGILFKDITPVLGNYAAFQEVVDKFVEWADVRSPDVIIGIESRGFVFGARRLGDGNRLRPRPQVGKLPHETIQEEYTLEYGTNIVEAHIDAVLPGQRVLIDDDLLATGGTASASARLVEKLGGKVVGFCFLIELDFLHGREVLGGYDLQSLIVY